LSEATVSILALGGTISMRGDAGRFASLDADELIASVPALQGIARLRSVTFRELPGAQLSLTDALALAGAVWEEFQRGADGVVIAQGTDTIEEVAFTLDLLVETSRPVVVTGAMRNPQLEGADGPANLLAAVQAAASQQLRGLGCVVVLGDEIHAARLVMKAHTSSPSAFISPLAGPIGWLSEGRPRIMLRPRRAAPLALPDPALLGRVALVSAVLGDDGGLVRAALAGGYQGMVLEALGGGHVPALMVEPLSAAVAAMPVVLASRAGVGEILRETYAFAGSERDLLSRGLLSAAWLNSRKARILLALLLASSDSRHVLCESFQAYLEEAVADGS
jgi:L-asparaginase